MKSLKFITAGSLMLALAGCFKEDYSYCPPEGEVEVNNVTLNFAMPDNGHDISDVRAASTAIYDADGELVQLIQTNAANHAEFQGVKTRLAPGQYRVISWGNTGTNTAHRNVDYHYTPGAEAHVTYGDSASGSVGTGDDLFYAPNTVNAARTRMGTGAGNSEGEYVMTVTEKGHEGTLNFRPAHRHVEIYVKNFNDGEGGTTPIVELTDLPHGLTFGGMQHIEDGEHVTAQMTTDMVDVGKDGEEGRFALSRFDTFHFHLNEVDTDVNIINPLNGEVVETIHLHDWYAAETDDPDETHEIKLLVEFLGATDVRVSIPGWGAEDVDYGTF